MDLGSITVEHAAGSVTVVEVAGEQDIHSAPSLRETLAVALDGGPVIVDMTPAAFVDSSILGVVLGAFRRARDDGRQFAVVIGDQAHLAVRRVFDVTGLVRVMPVYSTRAAAMDAMAERA
jgi:anti-sigma B factor antagonist